jgi:hypothetical protein
MAEITSIRGGKREPCLYCGCDPHPTPLACPRIAVLHVDPETACVSAIEFHESWKPANGGPTPPAAA